MAHSRPASDTAPRQIEIFAEEGVDLDKVQIAHCGDSPDPDYIESIIEKGVWAGLDRYGIEMYLPFEPRIAAHLALSSADTRTASSSRPTLARRSTGSRPKPASNGGGRRDQGLDDQDRPRQRSSPRSAKAA